ncbi:MAG: APA family basic amino acid/polyamine antiporter [Planctomycetota bacterium]
MSDTGTQASGIGRYVNLRSATALVVANIIGAGIFTTTGFQAADLPHPGYIFVLWVVGGVLALCGAACYAELGAALPEAGGEYVYLRKAYGPFLGFLTAFVSLIAGFSAPIASACKAFARYLAHFFPGLAGGGETVLAVGVVLFLTLVHTRAVRGGMRFNDYVTLLKVLGILAILLGALLVGQGELSNLTEVSPRFAEKSGSALASSFATALIFVMFCYSGFNASAYIAGEMKNPQRDLPRSLLFGTALVLLLYLGLNAVYFYGASVDELAGKAEVGIIASQNLFGSGGTHLVTLVLLVSILASASAMTIAGPRVYYALGKDHAPLTWLTRTSSKGAPVAALWIQCIIVIVLIVSGRMDQIQQYAGFTLALFSSLAVASVIVLRRKFPDLVRPFRVWGYPFTPLLYLAMSTWMMVWAFGGRPLESSLSLATVLLGGGLYFLLRRKNKNSA